MGSETDGGSAVTALLREWSGGDKGALDRLVPLVYDELRQVAQAQLRKERHARTEVRDGTTVYRGRWGRPLA